MNKKKGIAIAVCWLFATIMFFVYTVQTSSFTHQLDGQSARIRQIQNEIEAKKSAQAKDDIAQQQTLTGLDEERTLRDDANAEEFLEYVMTWSSYNEYESIRQSCMADYGMTADSRFMQVFMPEIVDTTSVNGNHYNRIDTMGLNVQYEGMDSFVRSISGTTYSYYSFVTWSSQDKNGHEATATALFLYDVDVDGTLHNIDAYAILS